MANNVYTQINDKVNKSADHSLGSGWEGHNGAEEKSFIFFSKWYFVSDEPHAISIKI